MTNLKLPGGIPAYGMKEGASPVRIRFSRWRYSLHKCDLCKRRVWPFELGARVLPRDPASTIDPASAHAVCLSLAAILGLLQAAMSGVGKVVLGAVGAMASMNQTMDEEEMPDDDPVH